MIPNVGEVLFHSPYPFQVSYRIKVLLDSILWQSNIETLVVDSTPTANGGIIAINRPLLSVEELQLQNEQQQPLLQQQQQQQQQQQRGGNNNNPKDYSKDVLDVLNKMKKQINKFRHVRLFKFPEIEPYKAKLGSPNYDLTILEASTNECYFSEDGHSKWQSRRLVNVGGYQYATQQDFVVGQNYNFRLMINDPDTTTSCRTIQLRIYRDYTGLLSIPEFICIEQQDNNNDDDNNGDHAGDQQQQPKVVKQLQDTFKLMTYNIWNYNKPWRIRSKLITDIIKDHQPDVIALQELRYSKWDGEHYKESPKLMGQERNQIQHIVNLLSFHNLKYNYYYLPSMIYNNEVDGLQMEGLGILSKHPIVKIESTKLTNDHIDDTTDTHQRSCLLATINIDGRHLNVLTSHFSLSFQGGQRNAYEIHNWTKQYDDAPNILVGDFNAEPNSHPIQFLTGKHSIKDNTGDFKDMYDTYCQSNPDNSICTTKGGITYRDVGDVSIEKRIDFIMVKQSSKSTTTNQIELTNLESVGGQRFDDNGIPLSIFPSDHSGLVSTFKFI
ncbi:hypothetical protein DFA_04792 [Cavenderia fasciculata]|uniref:Endonuclease/exonuclease/phosphatase domain-containing protein n=1 Tax=Cavenderia fasciculata TaxID=261658 RepID=F4PNY3_CACFS|nr:uncharacterized protein DFA_04792 [Cavenderia fasciculata]EGG22662.1 hypothetical protein DFA_04792 [Cavenderia fasciculata]|eukprot:XP_004360513.1 hypothetical protein DFA_04792 [Cavenderia fasciculata]